MDSGAAIVVGACSGLAGVAVLCLAYMLAAFYLAHGRYVRASARYQQSLLAMPLQHTNLRSFHSHHESNEELDPPTAGPEEAEMPPPPVVPRRDPLRQSKWLDLAAIRSLIEDLSALEEQFRSVPVNDVSVEQLSNEVLDKNRYINILPNPHSRVVLSRENNDPSTEYINANWVDGFSREKEYILTQGPLGTTIIDFWRMMWETGSRNIVMIARLVEDGRPKCVKYWAERDEKFKIDRYLLAWTETTVQPFFKITTMRLGNTETREVRTIRHFWCDSWPDHGVPETTESVTALIMATLAARKEADAEAGDGIKRPMVVHCSAGVGRSGVFAAADIGIQQVETFRKVDTLGLLCHLRRARGGCVQTATQWLFFLLIMRSHLTLLELYEEEEGSSPGSRASTAASPKHSIDI